MKRIQLRITRKARNTTKRNFIRRELKERRAEEPDK
jgi:ribonuclease P protein component